MVSMLATPAQATLFMQMIQTITFYAQTSPQLFVNNAHYFISPAKTSSGLTVTYSSKTPGVCSVSGTSYTMLAAGTCTIAANQAGDSTYLPAQEVTQNVWIRPRTVNVSKAGGGFGTVTSSPAGISCGAACSADFDGGSNITLTPTPAIGSIFSGWSGGGCSGTGTCNITWPPNTYAQTVTATFSSSLTIIPFPTVPQTVTFDAQPSPQTYINGQTMSISPAKASSGLTVTYSSKTPGVCSVSGTSYTMLAAGTCTIAANQPGDGSYAAATEVTQNVLLNPLALSVSKMGNGSGTVTSSPFGINCGAVCSANFAGAPITLTATSGSESFFTGWSGGGCSGTGTCSVIWSPGVYSQAVTATFSSVVAVPVVEFYNTNLDNYFITSDANEAAAIDSGGAGPGWIRTGYTFKSGGTTSVCRFYGSQSPGPNSHFYTIDPGECKGLKQLQASTPDTEKRWNFESLDFISTPPSSGACPAGTEPVYRAYNNGFARGVGSNHRINSNLAAIQEVLNHGWKNEGIVMCAPQ